MKKKLLSLLALMTICVASAWAETTVIARMQDLVSAGTVDGATVSTTYATNEVGGAVYDFANNGIIKGISNDAVKAALGSKYVTVAAWVYGRPTGGSIFSYGGQSDGIKFKLTGTTMQTTTKGKADYVAQADNNFGLENQWHLVAFSIDPGFTTTKYISGHQGHFGYLYTRYRANSGPAGMNTPAEADQLFAIGSGNQGDAREPFTGSIANLTVIASDNWLSASDLVADLVGAAPYYTGANVTYEYMLNGVKVAEETVEAVKGQAYPAPTTLPWGVSVTLPEGTVTGDATKQVTVTLADNYPFQYSTDFATATWYMLTIRSTYHPYYNSANGEFNNTGNNGAKVMEDKGYFAFVGSPWGTKIINRGAGEGKAITGTPTVNNSALGVGDFADGVDFIFENNSNHFVFAAKTNRVAHINNVASNAKLGFWTAAASATDGGSTLTFEEADLSVDAALKTAIADAKTLLNSLNVPVLFSAADVTTALNAVNAITYNKNDEQSVATATTQLNNIMNTLYATAAGKKFTYKSTMYNTVRYLTAPVAAGGLTTTEGISRINVFELEHVANANFKVKACSVDAYLNSTNTAAEGSIYNFIYQGQENYISLQFNGTANALHHQEYGHAVVSWDTNSNASKWYVAAVTDDEWAAMTALPDVTALQTLISNTKAGYYDDWNGVWRIGAGLNNYNYITEPAEGMDLQTYLTTAQNFIDNLTADNTDAEVAEHIANINSIIANLTINQPADGSFLRIRSVKSGYGYVNAETSTAHNGCLAVGGQKASSIFYYKDGKLLSYTEGQYIIKNNSGSGFAALGATGAEGTSITFGQATKQAGCYTVIYSGNRYLYAADNATNTDAGGSEGNNGYDFWLEEVTSLPVTVSAAGYATLYAPVALQVPAEVTAYTLAENGEYLKATEVNGTIPANTGVILNAEPETYSFNVTTGGEGTSCLSGTVATIAKLEASIYTLANGDNGIGFYNYTGETLKGFRAYFKKASDARGFIIDFGGETGVVMVNESTSQRDNKIYNLAGQRVNKAEKGIYIINGKKVLK